jgi:hypothetical protein
MANRKRIEMIDRFWEYVDRGKPDQCWPWLGSTTEKGYGQFRLPDRVVKSHRMAWAIAHNVTPDALRALPIDVHHTCENNDCCNPAHLAAIDSDSHDRLHARDLSRMIKRLVKQ